MLLSYAALDIDPLDRLDTMRQYDTARDGKLNRVEFCQLCVDLLWNVDVDHLERRTASLRVAIPHWTSLGAPLRSDSQRPRRSMTRPVSSTPPRAL